MRAVKAIKVGEEVTSYYLDGYTAILEDRKEKKLKLENWNFKCKCDICLQSHLHLRFQFSSLSSAR